ncbi:hypothetical protein DAMA08_020270 [Martiniozyma asiatica (nom. inval.)]|nr:hypothetical protein DAMA08_020270 [Martiniozyma asiatica]
MFSTNATSTSTSNSTLNSKAQQLRNQKHPKLKIFFSFKTTSKSNSVNSNTHHGQFLPSPARSPSTPKESKENGLTSAASPTRSKDFTQMASPDSSPMGRLRTTNAVQKRQSMIITDRHITDSNYTYTTFPNLDSHQIDETSSIISMGNSIESDFARDCTPKIISNVEAPISQCADEVQLVQTSSCLIFGGNDNLSCEDIFSQQLADSTDTRLEEKCNRTSLYFI